MTPTAPISGPCTLPASRLALPVLSTCYFTVGIGTLSVVGLMAPIARGLGVSPNMIALLASAFALTYALAAPLMQMLIGHWDRRRLIEIGLLTMAAGAGIAAVSPGWWTLVAARVLMAVGAGLAGPMSSATGAAIVPPDRRGAALSTVFAGMPVATTIGVPLSAWLGQILGWRPVMSLVAALALAVLATVRRVVPASPGGRRTAPRALLGTIADRVLAPAIGVTFFQMAALFATYALIPEFLSRDYDVSQSLMPFGLAAYGIGGVLGNYLAGRWQQVTGPERTILFSLIALMIAFVGLSCAPGVPVAALALTFLWGMMGMFMLAPQQARLVRIAPETVNLVLAVNGSALYFGVAAGSALSSRMTDLYGVEALPGLSAGLTGLAIVLLQVSRKAERNSERRLAVAGGRR